ncbi:MAG: hypothetical protein HY825_16250 [Acidobacteria bacterium]|nr:hypothetical protein [Acidobacteriota bacterium]
MDVLLIDFRGTRELLAQREHLGRGCLFVPEPAPAPAELADVLLRVRAPHGEVADFRVRVLQVYAGAGVALELCDAAAARRVLEAWFASVSRLAASSEPTRIGWLKEAEAAPMPASPGPAEGVACAPAVELGGVPAVPTADEVSPPAPGEGAGEKPSALLVDQIRDMNAQQRMHLAAHGDRAARLILVKDPNKTIQTFLLQNKHITIEEVRYLAGSRQASPDALQTIAANRDWVQNPGVVAALVRNPKTPQSAAVRLLDRVGETELRRLAKSGDVPRGVQMAARKKLNV